MQTDRCPLPSQQRLVAAEKKKPGKEKASGPVVDKKAASKTKPAEKDSLQALRKEIEGLKREVASLKAALGKKQQANPGKKPLKK